MKTRKQSINKVRHQSKKNHRKWALAWKPFSALEKVIIITVIIAGVAGLYWQRYSLGLANSKQPSTNQTTADSPKSGDTFNPAVIPSANPAPTTATPSPTPPASHKPDCAKLNSDEQSIVDSALQSSYEYYLYQKNATLSDNSMTDSAKEHQITHDYTSYQWKVEDWQGDSNRTISGAGCTSTVVAKLQPR